MEVVAPQPAVDHAAELWVAATRFDAFVRGGQLEEQMKILANDGLAQEGIALLERHGFEVDAHKRHHDRLVAQIGDFDGLIVRSATEVSRDVVEAAARLKIIGRAGAGLDVYSDEPKAEGASFSADFRELDGVVMTPHLLAVHLPQGHARHVCQD